jgi:hypothetical protein
MVDELILGEFGLGFDKKQNHLGKLLVIVDGIREVFD